MNFLRRLFRNDITTNNLGRWKIHYDPKIVDLKITQANEDNCGCCAIPEMDIEKDVTNYNTFALMCIPKLNNSIIKLNTLYN